jgi:hypothetical protein
MLLINVYHGGQILNISTVVGYDIYAACIFSVNETINLHDLKRQYHTGLEMFPIQYTIVRSFGQIQQKSTKEREGRYTFMVMDEMKSRINRMPTRGRAHSNRV